MAESHDLHTMDPNLIALQFCSDAWLSVQRSVSLLQITST